MSHDGEYKFDDPWITGLVKELQDEIKALRATMAAAPVAPVDDIRSVTNAVLDWSNKHMEEHQTALKVAAWLDAIGVQP